MPRLLSFVAGCAFALFSVLAFAQSAEPSPQSDATVKIHTHHPGGGGYGSGVVIAAGNGRAYVMTNAHVVKDAVKRSGFVVAYPPRHPPIYLDRLHAMGDPDNGEDLAVFSGPAPNPPQPMAIAESELAPGDPVYFAGYPAGGGLSVRNATATDQKTFVGENFVQSLDRSAAQGMSGGPVYTRDGRVAGIVFATESEGEGSLAIKVGPIRRLLARVFPRLANARAEARNVIPTQCPPSGCQIIATPQPQIPMRSVMTPSVRQPQLPPQTVAPSRPVMPDLSGYVTRDELDGFVRRSDLPSVVTVEQFNNEIDGLAGGIKTQLSRELSHYVRQDQLREYAQRDQVADAMTSLQSRITTHVDNRVTNVVGEAASKLSWVEAAGKIAADFGLATLIPGGGFALIGLKLAGLVLAHRRERKSKPAGGPDAPFSNGAAAPTPPPPPRPDPPAMPNATVTQTPAPRTETEFVRVPTVNREAEALQEAMRREVRQFPAHAPIVERLKSSAKQLNHGRDVTDSGRGDPSQPRPAVGWSD